MPNYDISEYILPRIFYTQYFINNLQFLYYPLLKQLN